MKLNTAIRAFALLALCGCTAQTANSPSSTQKSGLVLANFDRNVRPQDDFYRFVNGTWIAKTEIPADRANYGIFTQLDDRAEQNVREILESAALAKSGDPETQQV